MSRSVRKGGNRPRDGRRQIRRWMARLIELDWQLQFWELPWYEEQSS